MLHYCEDYFQLSTFSLHIALVEEDPETMKDK